MPSEKEHNTIKYHQTNRVLQKVGLVSGFHQPMLKNMIVKMGSSSPNFRGENKTCLFLTTNQMVDGVTSQVAEVLMGAGCNF